MPSTHRRPLKSRSTAWAGFVAERLARSPLTPNQISLLGLVFALLGSALLMTWPQSPTVLVASAICVQLRLLCNLLDGMVAVEAGKGTASGPLYNEVPDRIADSLFLIALGYAADAPTLGWLAALLAVQTAYQRALGGSLGLAQDFGGPLAKPQRMAALTACLLLAAAERPLYDSAHALTFGLWFIVVGTALTCLLRLWRCARALEQRAQAPSPAALPSLPRAMQVVALLRGYGGELLEALTAPERPTAAQFQALFDLTVADVEDYVRRHGLPPGTCHRHAGAADGLYVVGPPRLAAAGEYRVYWQERGVQDQVATVSSHADAELAAARTALERSLAGLGCGPLRG